MFILNVIVITYGSGVVLKVGLNRFAGIMTIVIIGFGIVGFIISLGLLIKEILVYKKLSISGR
jgi:hypothetical protein